MDRRFRRLSVIQTRFGIFHFLRGSVEEQSAT